MSSEITRLYESLLANKRVTLSFASKQSLESVYGQLRTIKTRYDQKYLAAFNESLSAGKVIRYELSVACDGIANNEDTLQATFFLGDPKPRTKTKFTILSVTSNDK